MLDVRTPFFIFQNIFARNSIFEKAPTSLMLYYDGESFIGVKLGAIACFAVLSLKKWEEQIVRDSN